MFIPCLSSFDRILETNHGLETDYLRVLYYEFPRYYRDLYHSYEYPRFCTILNGQKKVSYDGCSPFIYDDSQFLLLPPNSSVLMEISIPTRALVLEISDNLIQKIKDKVSNDLELDIPRESKQNCFDFSLSPFVNNAYHHVVEACFNKERNKTFLLDLYAQELVYHLICVQSTGNLLISDYANPILRTIGFMSSNWNQKESLEELASMANMSINTYIHQFKTLTGMTPTEYRTGVRMSHARNLLRSQTVTEAALELGYENVSHFIRVFKKRFGITPKHFQKLYNENLTITEKST